MEDELEMQTDKLEDLEDDIEDPSLSDDPNKDDGDELNKDDKEVIIDQTDAEKALQAQLDERDQEVLGLRQLTRDNKRTMDDLNSKITNMDEILRKANLISEEDEAALSERKEEFNKRTLYLSNLQETMRMNPKYEDVDQVVSQTNLDDIVQAIAETYMEDDPSLNLNQLVMEVENKIWDLPNPYKYMYDLIKNNHPNYAKNEKEEKVDDVDKIAEQHRKTNLGDLSGGGSEDLTGWTTARIDKMDEDELGKVPAVVYTKYMQGTLK